LTPSSTFLKRKEKEKEKVFEDWSNAVVGKADGNCVKTILNYGRGPSSV